MRKFVDMIESKNPSNEDIKGQSSNPKSPVFIALLKINQEISKLAARQDQLIELREKLFIKSKVYYFDEKDINKYLKIVKIK